MNTTPATGSASEPLATTGEQPDSASSDLIPFRQAFRAWALISLQTFGGPAGQIAVMQRTLVDQKRWISQQRFLHALNYCMLLPGPEAQQLSIYIGWLLNGTRGGLAAGTLFVLPGAMAMLVLSMVYVRFGGTTVVTAVFAGVAPAVLAIVAHAVWRVGSRALAHPALIGIATAAFAALALFAVPFPLVVAGAAAAGWALGRWAPAAIHRPYEIEGAQAGPEPLIADSDLHHEPPSRRRTVKILCAGLVLWAVPVAAAAVLLGPNSTLTTQGLFFSGTALVTFGGAYAVLAYVAHQAVDIYGWLSAKDMIRGLALAETTPGPLIMVVQFVAFLGAYHHPGPLNPWVAGILGSVLVTWVTFVPSFLFILLGAPYVERLRGNRALSAALTGITAAVVGVIANLGVYFAVHTLFAATTLHAWGPLRADLPQMGSLRPVAAGIAVIAVGLVFMLRWPVLRTLGVCAILGVAAALIGLPVS